VRLRLVLLLPLLLPALVACDGQEPDEQSAPTPPPSSTSPSATAPQRDTVVRTRLPADLSALPWADVGLPARMPTGQESMPWLLDDPPGRAVMSYRPVESWDDPRGWASETIYILGTDGSWRRLAMAGLGLAEEWWPGPDTYGAGQVSPDGRWWASHVGPHVLLLDLRTGEQRLAHLGDDRSVRFVRWLQGSDVLQAFSNRASGNVGVSSTHLVHVSGKVRVSPYGRDAVAFEPDGTAVRFTRTHLLRWASESATPTRDPVPGFWRAQRRSSTAHHGERLSIVPIFRELAEVDDLLAVDGTSLEPVARLVNRRGGYVGPGETLGTSFGWLDEKTLLTSTSSWLVTWTPAEGELRRVVRMPRVPPYVWAGWSASFALDLLTPPRRR
jgi:hypothetical protein